MRDIKIVEGYSYDDMLISPKYSDKTSRKNISLATRISRNITLNLPLVSANMDTITEDAMAVEMALRGGIGIIHRFCSIEDQVAMVKKVKRHTHHIIQSPYTVHKEAPITDILEKSKEYNVSSFLIVDDDERLTGIVSNRDIAFYQRKIQNDCPNPQMYKAEHIATPFNKLITAHSDISSDDAVSLMVENRIEKLPLIDENRNITGLMTLKNILYNRRTYTISTIDKTGSLRVGAAVGINKDYLERTEELVKAGCDIIVIDVAHGHHKLVKDAINNIHILLNGLSELTRYKPDIIAGNVCTPEGAQFLCECDVDGIKVGVGPGSICTTRIQTGCGFPQFSAVMNCAKVADEYGIPIIADGGHRGKIGNIVKALAIGSSCSMLGGFISGTAETPGSVMVKGNKKVKMIRGMAGRMANLNKSIKNKEDIDIENMTPEGVEGYVPYKGRVKYILDQIRGGIQSGLSYCGVSSIEELHNSSLEFVKMTGAGLLESGSHDITEI